VIRKAGNDWHVLIPNYAQAVKEFSADSMGQAKMFAGLAKPSSASALFASGE